VFGGIGIDIEQREPLTDELRDIIFPDPRERALASADPINRPWLFCAKGAAFKATCPAIRRRIGFEDFLIESSVTDGEYFAKFRIGIASFRCGDGICGRW
jgi:4'-phosphopantetheinyl transferase EntD